MLNPIKTPQEMLYEQAGVPHFGKGGDVISQFTKRIQDAITKYTRATGKPPSPEEVKQLEDHIRGLSQPSPQPQQTQARLAQQTPFASHLVDEFGRPYQPMIDPKTGRLTTPERAQGFNVQDPFKTTPVSAKARKYVPGANAFTPDEFLNQANTGRTSTRTNMRSHTPSSEELIAKQNAAEEIGGDAAKAPLETYGPTEQPRSASEPFASQASAFEQVPAGDIRQEILPAVYPREGEARSKFAAEVEQARQSFLARGIEPDEEDLINAVIAARNPMRHNYTGENPIGERPLSDPTAGKVSPEMLEWRDRMRAAGQPETLAVKHPSDWKPSAQREYLLDTTPETRQPFARDWTLEETVDRRRKQVPNKAEGGMMRSPRDMHAELLVNGYDKGGMTGPATGLSKYLDRKSQRGDYYTPETYAYDVMNYDRGYDTNPAARAKTPSERISETGQKLLEKTGISPARARRLSQTFTTGGEDSYLPFGLGATGVAGMVSLPGFLATAPLYAADTARNMEEGNWGSVAADALMTNPGMRAVKSLARSPRLVGGTLAGGAAGVNADPHEGFRNPFEYRSVLERN